MAMYDMVIPIFSAGCTFVIVLNQFSNLPSKCVWEEIVGGTMREGDTLSSAELTTGAEPDQLEFCHPMPQAKCLCGM